MKRRFRWCLPSLEARDGRKRCPFAGDGQDGGAAPTFAPFLAALPRSQSIFKAVEAPTVRLHGAPLLGDFKLIYF